MKRLLFLFLMLFLANACFSQLEVKDGSFKEVMGFVNINTDKMYDDNDQPYAVLKIKTENLSSKERRELNFGGDARTFFEAEYKDGEVWLYISYYASFIKISHEELSSTEFYFPFDMQPKKGYELTLVNKTAPAVAGSGSLTVTTKPENGATIALNGKVLNQKTPYSNDMIAAGQYEITVSKFGCENVTRIVTIIDGQTTDLEIEMPFKYGSIIVNTEPSGAVVLIDGIEYGMTPLTLDSIRFGTHELKVNKYKWKSHFERFEIIDENLVDIDVVLNNCPDGAINGVFSIGQIKKVYFSQGNLQYQASAKLWKFAENQWDMIDTDNKNISANYNGWIDLFGWGTGNSPIKHTTDNADYISFKDWGINAISNGEKNKWRTLTKDEWKYLFDDRKTPSGIRYAKAIVNGIYGVIILPDNWSDLYYNLKNTNESESSFDANIISKLVWKSKLESNGAVFLPAAGYRSGVSISMGGKVGSYVLASGGYWSSKSTNNAMYSYNLYFSDNSLNPENYGNRNAGLSVRLVCPAE